MALQEEFEKQGNCLFKYRSHMPILVLLMGLVLYIIKEIHPETSFIKDLSLEIYFESLALFISLIGLFIRVYTVGHTPKNTSGRNTKEGQVADSLNTSGIYSIVRHPLYLGNFLMWFGPVMLTGHLWFIAFFILFYWLYYERIMYAEEQFLRKKFGTQYLEWSKNVPAFIPKLHQFRKSDLPFSFRKVLKKEKNGLFALFLIFCVFDLSGAYLNPETGYSYFLISMSILTGLAYVIIKFIKNKTTWLEEVNR